MREPTANLATMYRQRIPTTSTRVGPRQTTVNDVRRVATYGRAAMPTYDRPPVQQFLVDPAVIQADIIGGPGAGYGLKYGGFPTQSAQEDAIRGEAYAAYEMADLARQQAAALAQPAEERYAYNIDPTRGGMAGKAFSEANRILNMPLAELAKQMARPGETTVDEERYGAAMARMNAVRGTGDYLTPEGNMPTGAQQIQYNTQTSIEPEARREYERSVVESGADRYQQIADIVGDTPVSEFAQQIATSRYGMDPAQAAGMFGVDMDIKYQKDVDNARRLAEGMPQITMDQFIWDNYGPEEYQNYMFRKAEQLLYGSPEEIAQAEQDAIDLANDLTISENYGFRPTDISGVDPAAVREAFANEPFQAFMEDGIATYNDPEKMQDYVTPTILGNELAQQWLSQGGTMAEAQVIQRIFATFDFTG